MPNDKDDDWDQSTLMPLSLENLSLFDIYAFDYKLPWL